MPVVQLEKHMIERSPANEKRTILGPFLKMHGRGCMSYSTLQPEFEYLVDDNMGYIAYFTFKHPCLAPRGRKIVLADPIAAPEDWQTLLRKFLARYPDVIFLQVSRQFACVLDDYGLQVNQLGVETELTLKDFTLNGKGRGKLRQWRNTCRREGILVGESDILRMDLAEVQRISQDWLRRKGGHELRILTRPLVYTHEDDVRYFWATQNEKLVGMAIFDPMYDRNRVIGYYHNFDRIISNVPHGTGAYCVVEAISRFQLEGVSVLSLGLSPLSEINDDLNHSRTLSRIAHLL